MPQEEPHFYLPNAYFTEQILALLLSKFTGETQKISPCTGNLDEAQSRAVLNACNYKASILTGFAGTGKTTTVGGIVESFSKAGMRGVIACPTGKAAKRAKASIKSTDLEKKPRCQTTYSALGYGMSENADETYQYNFNNKLPFDYVIVDEFPMLDAFQARDLLLALDPSKTRIVFSGDPNQLPSVDSGNFGHDLISSGVFPVVSLETIYRQDENSGIIHNAKKILDGLNPSKYTDEGLQFNDWFFIPSETPLSTKKKICELVTEKIPKKYGVDPIQDIQVLSPGKKGDCGSIELNKSLRHILNPESQDSPGSFCEGDKVINRKNNKQLDIVNGDTGIIKEIGKKGMTVEFDDRTVFISSENEDVLIEHSYCYTVHLSQGSEMPIALTPIHSVHYTLLYRNLLYTANTRPRQKKYFIGDIKYFLRGIRRTIVDKRTTRLSTSLKTLLRKEAAHALQNH